MKLRELIKEEQEVNLLGLTIDDILITPEIQNETWENGFFANNRRLTSLRGCPKIINGPFYCSDNKLTSLKYGPVKVAGTFSCFSNRLTSLEGAPKEVGTDGFGGNFDCSYNQITSLKDVHKIIHKINGNFDCTVNKIKSHVLGLLLIPGLSRIISTDEWKHILNKYIGKGRKGMLDCQNELIEAGLEEYAQL